MGIRHETGKRLDLHTKVLPELEIGDYVQMQNLWVSHPLKSDRAGMVVSKNGFLNYSVKVFGSATVTKRNRATLRKVDPRSIPGYQCENLYSAQEVLGLSQTPSVSREPLVRQRASKELGALGLESLRSRPFGQFSRPFAQSSCPAQSPSPVAQPSRPVAQPMRLVEGSVDGNVGLSEPLHLQSSVVRPGAGTNGEGLELSQVNPVSGDNAGDKNGLRRSTRVVQRPDRYGIEYIN